MIFWQALFIVGFERCSNLEQCKFVRCYQAVSNASRAAHFNIVIHSFIKCCVRCVLPAMHIEQTKFVLHFSRVHAQLMEQPREEKRQINCEWKNKTKRREWTVDIGREWTKEQQLNHLLLWRNALIIYYYYYLRTKKPKRISTQLK